MTFLNGIKNNYTLIFALQILVLFLPFGIDYDYSGQYRRSKSFIMLEYAMNSNQFLLIMYVILMISTYSIVRNPESLSFSKTIGIFFLYLLCLMSPMIIEQGDVNMEPYIGFFILALLMFFQVFYGLITTFRLKRRSKKARKGGFESINEMETALKEGFMTKSDYLNASMSDEARAMALGFENPQDMRQAISLGFGDRRELEYAKSLNITNKRAYIQSVVLEAIKATHKIYGSDLISYHDVMDYIENHPSPIEVVIDGDQLDGIVKQLIAKEDISAHVVRSKSNDKMEYQLNLAPNDSNNILEVEKTNGSASEISEVSSLQSHNETVSEVVQVKRKSTEAASKELKEMTQQSSQTEQISENETDLIFISFSSQDKDIGLDIYHKLKSKGFTPWLASQDIKIGTEYNEEIVKAIDRSKYFVLLVTSTSVTSRHVKTELERAFSKGLTILPLILDDVEIPIGWEYYLNLSQWMDCKGIKQDDWVNSLIARIDSERLGKTIFAKQCVFCLNELNSLGRCVNCSEECGVCKRAIAIGEDWTTCNAKGDTACGKPAHHKHLYAYVQSNGACPTCKNKLTLADYSISRDWQQKVASHIGSIVGDERGYSIEEREMLAQKIGIKYITVVNQVESGNDLVVNKLLEIKQDESIASDEKTNKQLSVIDPLVSNVVLLREFVDLYQMEELSVKQYPKILSTIISNFDVFDEFKGLITNYHQYNNTTIHRLKSIIKNEINNPWDKEITSLLEESGLYSVVQNYIREITGDGFHNILQIIDDNLKTTNVDPIAWMKFLLVFL